MSSTSVEPQRGGSVRDPGPDDDDLGVGGPMSSGLGRVSTSSIAINPTSSLDEPEPDDNDLGVNGQMTSGFDQALASSLVTNPTPPLDLGTDVPMTAVPITMSLPSASGTDVVVDALSAEVVKTTLGTDDPEPTEDPDDLEPAEDPDDPEAAGSLLDDSLFVDDESPNLPPGDAFGSSSSCSSDSRVYSDEDEDEDVSVEVERMKKAKKVKKKATAKVCPDPPGSSLTKEKSLRLLRRKCGISEEIVLVAPTPADRADAPPAGYITLFENYFDQCLLWFPLPRFLMRFLAVHGVCLAQINPRGIKHLLGIYVLSRECGVDISTENLSYLTDFRTRGLSEELKHSVTNSSGMALIAGFPSKDDHFEYRFFFAEISERTVEADCINLVKTKWERRVKPTLPKVSKEFLAAMHKELSSGNDNWKRSFSRKRIERALSAETLPGKILGRGQARLSLREQIALEAATKGGDADDPDLLPPPSSGDVAEFHRLSAERARISSGKGMGIDRVTPSKRRRVDAPLQQLSAERLQRALSLLFDRLVGDYDEDVRSRGSELSAAKEANAALQSRLDETVERNEALERDALALHGVKKGYKDKLARLKSRCPKAEGETVRLKGELCSASDLQCSRIDAAVAEVRDEMTYSFAERTSKVAGLLAEIGGTAQNDMLNLTEVDANLEFIGLLQGSDLPDLPTEVKMLRKRRLPIYDAHDVFADLLVSVRRVLEIPVIPAETSVAVDDDAEVSDEDNVEETDDDEGAED
ncbi:hypothetical protein AALP_AA3G300100 [Arabis alpina]|uniref:Uncharacterized protein n=1 Tax=Arabis alpina TaxID=50452 RepID=A0A087HCM5_ARAAL|nr:hypothetical protein AALP_AA3G300100 [Arabis alpina]